MSEDYTLPDDLLDRIEDNPHHFEFNSYLPKDNTVCGHTGPFLHNREEYWELCLRCGEETHY